MSVKVSVSIQEHNNKDIVQLGIRPQVSKTHRTFRRGTDISREDEQKVGYPGIGVVRSLLTIKGIAQIDIEPLELYIKKGSAYDWGGDDNIKARAKTVVEEYLATFWAFDTYLDKVLDSLEFADTEKPKKPRKRKASRKKRRK